MSAALGTLRLHIADLGTIVVDAPSTAASPDAERAWVIARRPRVASHQDASEGNSAPAEQRWSE
jgi:hypothetical protein